MRILTSNLHKIRGLLREAALDKHASLRASTMMKLLSKGGSFGIISAYRSGVPKSQNQTKNGELFADLQRAGYRKIIPLKGSWEGITEKSVLVPNINAQLLFELGRKYAQDAVIFKAKDGVLGMYYIKERSVEVAVDPEGDPTFEIAQDQSLYSKSRGISFQFGFLWGQKLPWNGQSPLSKRVLRDYVEKTLDFAA